MLKNEDRILSSAISTVTGYNIDGKALQFGALLKLEDKDIHNAVKRVVPQIQSCLLYTSDAADEL